LHFRTSAENNVDGVIVSVARKTIRTTTHIGLELVPISAFTTARNFCFSMEKQRNNEKGVSQPKRETPFYRARMPD
jgi:hypothetical protein